MSKSPISPGMDGSRSGFVRSVGALWALLAFTEFSRPSIEAQSMGTLDEARFG